MTRYLEYLSIVQNAIVVLSGSFLVLLTIYLTRSKAPKTNNLQ